VKYYVVDAFANKVFEGNPADFASVKIDHFANRTCWPSHSRII